jgi:sulfite exporter TauE/SafE
MKKFLVALVALLIAAAPMNAEAQQKKKKKQQDEDNPIALLLGIFSTANCILTCGGITSTVSNLVTTTSTITTTTFVTVTTTVYVPQLERFVTTTTQVPVTTTQTVNTTNSQGVLKNKILSGYATGALICTLVWPFINHFAGGKEPTSEEAVMNMVSCWVPGLGIIAYLAQQQPKS